MTAIQLTMMSADEARACVDDIKSNLETVREQLFDLREREGWRALGYPTWQAFIQEEFHLSKQRAHQLLNAHAVDRILAAPWQESSAFFGTSANDERGSTKVDPQPPVARIPETHARELEPLIDDPDALREVYSRVQLETPGVITAADVRRVVDEHFGIEPEQATPPPDEPITDLDGQQYATRPFVMPEPEQESEEARAYYHLARQRLVARYLPPIVAAAPPDAAVALPAWEEFEGWFQEFMAALRERAATPIRLAK